MAYCGSEVVLYLSQVQDSQLSVVLSLGTLNSFIEGTLIPKAEGIIDAYVGKRDGTLRYFNPHTSTTGIDLDGTGKNVLFLPPKYSPWINLGSVTIDGSAVAAVTDIKRHDQYLEYDGGHFNEGEQNVSLFGTYGYATVPEDVQLICAQICSNLLMDMVRRNVAPDVFMSLMQGAERGGAGFRTLFAQPTVFTKDMKQTLDEYRVYWVDVG